jgi:hypothetical protein
MTHKHGIFLFGILLLLVAALPAMAQDDVIADGLVNPRNIAYDADGNLYIAETGNAGDMFTLNDDPLGASGQITMIPADGTPGVLVRGFMSVNQGASRGLQAVQVIGDSIWVLQGEITDARAPFRSALIELNRETRAVKTYVDLLTPELENDPDGNPNGESNPTDFAVADDGTIYIANAGCNCLMSWAAGGEVEIAASWPHNSGNPETDNPVPTSVEIGPDGDIYVGFLTGFPFPEGGARIERWSGGELAETYTGLTTVTGLLVTDDGTIYASEFGVFVMGEGWSPGRVVTVNSDGITPVMEDVMFPFGLAQAPDGSVVVAVNSQGGADGMVVALPME